MRSVPLWRPMSCASSIKCDCCQSELRHFNGYVAVDLMTFGFALPEVFANLGWGKSRSKMLAFMASY